MGISGGYCTVPAWRAPQRSNLLRTSPAGRLPVSGAVLFGVIQQLLHDELGNRYQCRKSSAANPVDRELRAERDSVHWLDAHV